MRKHQSGFTLVEIAIVLVIIGLLLGGVLKGQEMIANGKYKSLRSDINSYGAAVYTFQDRFRALPGDMSAANAAAQLNFAGGGGTGDGLIANAVCAANAAAESCFVWRHLRAANLIGGDAALSGQAANPTHAYGGMMQGIVDATHGTRTGRWLVIQNIPGDVGARLDREIDDGLGASGIVFCAAGCAAGAYPGTGAVAPANVTVRVML